MTLMKKTTSPRFAIIRDSRNGRTWYQAKDVGCITRLRRSVWTTTSKDAAIVLAGEVGGTVVTFE